MGSGITIQADPELQDPQLYRILLQLILSYTESSVTADPQLQLILSHSRLQPTGLTSTPTSLRAAQTAQEHARTGHSPGQVWVTPSSGPRTSQFSRCGLWTPLRHSTLPQLCHSFAA